MVFKGDTPFKSIQYKAQHATHSKVFKKAGIHTSKVTRANRKSALNMIAQENVSRDQQRMVGCYVSSLPVEAMKNLAGFSGQQYSNYFLLKATIRPSVALQSLVFQDIEYWKDWSTNDITMQEDIADPKLPGLACTSASCVPLGLYCP
ncbi:hypothetical protein CLU79DRAFT_716070 [Phycomyces nitens]|nr:hypothetical protein CLU79DRAFT_716070 [Phycomyces nitens]